MENQKNISNVRLLLVEDNSRYLDRLERRLEKFGYQQRTIARSAAEATQLLAETYFDIIVADMKLEEDDSGFDVVDAVRQCPGGTPSLHPGGSGLFQQLGQR